MVLPNQTAPTIEYWLPASSTATTCREGVHERSHRKEPGGEIRGQITNALTKSK
jgi:hypothetical protein